MYSDVINVKKSKPSGRIHVAQWASQSVVAQRIHLVYPWS